jgi:hypothetical protein
VLEVHADSRPGAKTTTHRIDENVGGLEMGRSFWMARLPALQSCKRIRLELRPGNFHKRIFWLPAARRLHAAGFSRLLSIMGWPRSVTHPFALLPR